MKVTLAVMWVFYFGMFGYIIMASRQDGFVFFLVCGLALVWNTWAFLGGALRLEPGRSIGGGPVYRRVPLEPDETILFSAAAHEGFHGGQLFITNVRVIMLPLRSGLGGGEPIKIGLDHITDVRFASKGFGWPRARQRVAVTADDRTIEIRAWPGPRFMGLISGDKFADGVMAALGAGGVPIQRDADEAR